MCMKNLVISPSKAENTKKRNKLAKLIFQLISDV